MRSRARAGRWFRTTTLVVAGLVSAFGATPVGAAPLDAAATPVPSAVTWQTPTHLDATGDATQVDLIAYRLSYDDGVSAFVLEGRVDNLTDVDFAFGLLVDLDRDRANGCLGGDLGVSGLIAGGSPIGAVALSYPSGCTGASSQPVPEVTVTYDEATGSVSLRVPRSVLGSPVGFDWAAATQVAAEIDFGPDADLHEAFGYVRPFPDVPTDAFYTGPIAWLRSAGFTTGYGATGNYLPDALVTRAQMATFLHRLAGEPPAPPAPFVDIERPSFYAAAVDHLYAEGHTTGVRGTDRYASHDPVTRGQMVTFLWRVAGEPVAPHPTLSDVTDPAAFYYRAVGWAESEGITTGVGSSGQFRPDDPVTRGQMATFLQRAYAPYHSP